MRALARTRGWRMLGTGMGGRRSTDGKNRGREYIVHGGGGGYIVHGGGRGYIFHSGGGGYPAPVNLIGAEGQRERFRSPVMHQVHPDVSREAFEECTTEKEASFAARRQEGQHFRHQG